MSRTDSPPFEAPRCPYCDRVMSNREAAEQGACNDCHGAAYFPDEAYYEGARDPAWEE